jgi:hypothetical protein
MMGGRDLDELFRAWRSEPVPPTPPLDERAGSAVVGAALRRVAERKRRQGRVRRWGAALALAAAVTGLVVGVWAPFDPARIAAHGGPSVRVVAQEGEVAVTDDVGRMASEATRLSEGYGVRTERGGATLGFPSGASAQVANKSSLKISRARETEALYLARGGVEVEVPKLQPGRGFSVETPDALVTVHGTRFSVLVESTLEGPRTHVQVTRGIVSVQKEGREVFLTAGQAWPGDARASSAGSSPSAGSASDAGVGSANGDRVGSGAGWPLGEDAAQALGERTNQQQTQAAHAGDSAAASSQERRPRARGSLRQTRTFDPHELADQNERFARAMAAKKNGDRATALRELGEIVRRYRGSPLTQEVLVERLRLLRELGGGEAAAREARRYLRQFPQGYAVAEAEELLSEHP